MLKKYIIYLFLIIIYITQINAQQLNAVVVDASTKEPVSDVFVFMANSSIGTTTDVTGTFQLTIKEVAQTAILFSHLNYELLTINFTKGQAFQDTIYLKSADLDLELVEVSKKAKPKLRKKRLRKFKDAFLGESREVKYIKILNPEVLLFHVEGKKLIATASQALEIENKLLGYQLDFYLETFELDLLDKDVFYKGNPFFKPLESTKKELARYKRNRKKAYQKTSRKFFSNLVANKIDQEAYDLGYATLNRNGEVVDYQQITTDSLKIETIENNKYSLPIKAYLAVMDVSEKPAQTNNKAALSSNFSTGIKAVKQQELLTATSYLKSKSNQIILNKHGIILNALDIEEYGFWSEQRVAFLLPLDYIE